MEPNTPGEIRVAATYIDASLFKFNTYAMELAAVEAKIKAEDLRDPKCWDRMFALNSRLALNRRRLYAMREEMASTSIIPADLKKLMADPQNQTAVSKKTATDGDVSAMTAAEFEKREKIVAATKAAADAASSRRARRREWRATA